MSLSPAQTRYDIERDQLATRLDAEFGSLPRYRTDQIWKAWYDDATPPDRWTTLPQGLRSELATAFPAALEPVTESVSSNGNTVKFLWSLHDASLVETVLMLYPERATVCISSQAGCAMGCGFCATGQAGFARHLTVGEIVEQVARAKRRALDVDRRVSNVVYMGMGEPLANEPTVWSSIERLHDAFGLSARHITVSTVGIVPGIRKLAARSLPVNLAVSLHAANDELRNELVPINRRYDLDEVLAACHDYLAAKNRRISFEWALIDGVNDRESDAAELARLCHRLRPRAHVNLIPLNPTPGYAVRGSAPSRVEEFRQRLELLGVNATVRQNRGTDIDAACGQLAAGQPVTLARRQASSATVSDNSSAESTRDK